MKRHAELLAELHAELPDEILAVGTVKTSHGLKGYLKVKSLSGESEHFLRLKKLFIGTARRLRPFEVQDVVVRSSDLLLKLAGIEDRETADKYRGLDIWVDRREASKLAEGEYYFADLCRCRVVRKGREIGSVASVVEGGGRDFLEVKSNTGTMFLVPFAAAFVASVDIEHGSIELTEEYELP